MSDEENDKKLQDTRPLFLRAQDSDTWEKPTDVSWGDHFLKPDKPLSARHKTLARMIAMGMGTNEIAEKLNYTAARVSVLRSNSRIKQEVEKYLDRVHEQEISERMKELAPDALNTMEEILLSMNDPLKKENAARWILEKVTGKASQQIDVKGEISLGLFLDKLDKLQTKQLQSSKEETRDVTPEQEKDNFEQWLEEN